MRETPYTRVQTHTHNR